MPITAEYDREADALYVRLFDGDRGRAVEVDDSTYVDVDAANRAVGIEFLYPGMGLNLEGVVRRYALDAQSSEIIAAIGASGAPVSAPTVTGGQHLVSSAIVRIAVEGTVGAAREAGPPSVGHADSRPVQTATAA
jgi:uncharacterized protein YuzE